MLRFRAFILKPKLLNKNFKNLFSIKMSDLNDAVLTHATKKINLDEIVLNARKRIIEGGDRDELKVEELLNVLDNLTKFEFGRNLLINRGLTGYWTRYINLYPKLKHEYNIVNEIEKFILERSPGICASQQRFEIFQVLLAKHIKDEMKICSLPCGLMDDLLTLEISNTPNIRFVGIDIDEDSTKQAYETAKNKNIDGMCTFHTLDAWKIDIKNEFDIVTSNMLVQYCKSDEAIQKFYKIVYDSLKLNGILIIGCLLDPKTIDWSKTSYTSKEVKMSSFIFYEICQVNWTNYQSVDKMTHDLKNSGFKTIDVYYDKCKRFPTLLARK